MLVLDRHGTLSRYAFCAISGVEVHFGLAPPPGRPPSHGPVMIRPAALSVSQLSGQLLPLTEVSGPIGLEVCLLHELLS